MLYSKTNILTGKMEWEMMDELHDYNQELARAGFADMLHDYERNQKYYEALKKTISHLKAQNKHVHVLDIGTGTGLLSMMAVACGADHVTACEAFKPMVNVAKKCLKSNKMSDKIKIIEKRSTEIQVGADMDERANVLVTEVFDTELIGEGAISTFNHALENLLTKDCHVIPDNAIMYFQCVDSIKCKQWNWLQVDGVNVPKDYENVAGNSIFDVQLSEFNEFEALHEPIEAFRFCFSGREELKWENLSLVEVKSKINGSVDGIFMWWMCNMDREGEIKLSCAPKWASHHASDNLPWRDHWMQAVYFPTHALKFESNETFYVKCNHDEYSLWFDVFSQSQISNELESCMKFKQPTRMSLISRNRLAQLNDIKRTNMLKNILEHVQNSEMIIFIIQDDLSLISVYAAMMSFKHVYVTESNRHRRDCLQAIIKENCLADRITVLDKNPHEIVEGDLKHGKINIIFSELSFANCLLPWENLYIINAIRQLQPFLNESYLILPIKIRFKAILVEFEHLHKIRAPVGNCEGFNLTEFDKVIMAASKIADGFLETHFLWEYPCKPLSNVHDLFEFNLIKNDQYTFEDKHQEIRLTNSRLGKLNGAVVWHEIDFGNGNIIQTGLIEEPQEERNLKWTDKYKQAIHIFDRQYDLKEANQVNVVMCETKCNLNDGIFQLNFKIV